MLCLILTCVFSAIWIKIKVTSSLTVIDKELERLKKREGEQMIPEERIEWEFLTGLSIDYYRSL